MKKIVIGGAVFIGVALIATLVWLVVSGKLVVIWNGAAVQYSAASNVCGDDIVTAYNTATTYEYREGAESGLSIDSAGLQTVVDTIKGSVGYESDPTCQTILFWAAIEADNASSAEIALAALNNLHARRIFPDNNLRASVPLSQYQETIDYLSIPLVEGSTE